MSRRSRKRTGTVGGGWLGKAAIGLVVVLVLGAAGLYAAVRSYLHSEMFRTFLSQQASRAARVDGHFTPFRWDGLAVDTDAFDATGAGPVRSIKVEGLHTEVGVSGIRRGVWELRGSNIRRLDVVLDSGKPADSPRQEVPPVAEKPGPSKQSGWLPTQVEMQGVKVQELMVRSRIDQGPVNLSGMRVNVQPAAGHKAFDAELLGGTLRLPFPWLPEVRMDRARVRWQDGQVFVHNANAAVLGDGHLEATGEWNSGSRQYVFEGGVSDLKCEELLSEDWAKRFTGDVASDFTLDNRGGQPVARGQLSIRNGTLTALPMLDALAAYADTRRFRVLNLTDAHTEWRWKNGEILLTNFVLASEGLVRLEGTMTIRGQEMDGTFRLGLAPGTLARIPGAETDVFIAGERGLLWAPLRISGTLKDPKEDLTDRLIAAAGMRMFDVIPETGEKAIKFTRAILGESPSKTIDKGVKIIEEGAGIVKDVGGILDGILGGGGRPPAEPPPESQ